jgi:uncharacterized protein
MSSIVLGKSGEKNVSIDLDVLLRTRLLVQANSGGGKSWLLRRFAEQAFGKIPLILIDPEGEFASLREKFGFVLAGKGGETPADIRSAALLAHKLLELRASAVCDIYDLKPQTRHHWVRLFLESLVDAPKKLWRPTIVIVDEAHVYCPEKGQGESEAFGAMADLVTRGRKRGFCAVFATQRLAKLSKNVSAELLNRLIGMTFEDVDLERAAQTLSVPRADQIDFFKQMKVIEPGLFWGLGRAIAKDRTLVHVGNVETTHPEPGKASYSAEPPPPPEKVKALLPKLADLPKAAEEQAQTVADLKVEIRSLKAQARAQPAAPQPKTIEVPVLTAKEIDHLERIAKSIAESGANTLELGRAVKEKLDKIAVSLTRRPNAGDRPVAPTGTPHRAFSPPPRGRMKEGVRPSSNGNHAPEDLDGVQLRVVRAVRSLHDRNLPIDRVAIARWMGIHPNGGRFNDAVRTLKEAGLLDDDLNMTEKTPLVDPICEDGPEAILHLLDSSKKSRGARRLFEQILTEPAATREELAHRLGIHPNGGRFNDNLRWLKQMGVVPDRGPLKATEGVYL